MLERHFPGAMLLDFFPRWKEKESLRIQYLFVVFSIVWLLGHMCHYFLVLTNEEIETLKKPPEARKANEYQSQNLNLISRMYCFLDPQSFPQFFFLPSNSA